MIDVISSTESPNRDTYGEYGRSSYMFGKGIEAIKSAVSVEQYACDQGVELRGGGSELRGPCIIHGGSNPSAFSVSREHDTFRCFACGAHGDVLDLYQAIEGGLPQDALVALGRRYGVDLPERGSEWFKHQDDKSAVREELRRGLAKVYQRRLYRMFCDAGADPEEDAALWEAMHKPAWLCATRRVFG
jgi:DNA primase